MKRFAISINDDLKDEQCVWEVDVKTKEKNILFVNSKIYKMIKDGHTPQNILDEFMEFNKFGGE